MYLGIVFSKIFLHGGYVIFFKYFTYNIISTFDKMLLHFFVLNAKVDILLHISKYNTFRNFVIR